MTDSSVAGCFDTETAGRQSATGPGQASTISALPVAHPGMANALSWETSAIDSVDAGPSLLLAERCPNVFNGHSIVSIKLTINRNDATLDRFPVEDRVALSAFLRATLGATSVTCRPTEDRMSARQSANIGTVGVILIALILFGSCTTANPTATATPSRSSPTSTTLPTRPTAVSATPTPTNAPLTPPVLNDSLVTGRIDNVRQESLDTTALDLYVQRSEDVDSLPNLTGDRAGDVIIVLVPGAEADSLVVGDNVRMYIQMRGGPDHPFAFYGSQLQRQPQNAAGPQVAMPARPNAGLVRGRVVSAIRSDETAFDGGVVYRLELLLDQVTAVQGFANMLSNREGAILTVLVRGPTPDLAVSDVLEATVAFEGDESGAAYVARDVNILASSPPTELAGTPFRANAAIVTGVVVDVKPHNPQTSAHDGWVMELRVLAAKDVESMPNLVAGKLGAVFQVFTTEAQAKGLEPAARITANVALRVWLDMLVFVATDVESRPESGGMGQ